jgi:hypothetical protein
MELTAFGLCHIIILGALMFGSSSTTLKGNFFDFLLATNSNSFFSMFRMTFNFYLRSYGNSDDYSYERNLCFTWKWIFTYDFYSNGQILVTGKAKVLDRCQKIPSKSIIYGFSVTMFILSLWYQLLLFKAVTRQCIILYNIKSSLNWLETSHSQKSNSRQSSADIPVNNNNNNNSTQAPNLLVSIDNKNKSGSFSHSLSNPISNKNNTQDDQNQEEDEDDDETKENTELALLIRSRLSNLQISKSGKNNNNTGGGGGRGNRDRSRSQLQERLSLLSARSAHRTTSIDSTHSRLSQLEADIAVFQQAIRSLTWEDVFIIINLWFLVSSIGNLFALIYSIRIVVSGEDTIATPFLKGGLGLACLMYWFSLVQYLEFFPR